MSGETYGARKYLFDMLMKERSLDRDALDECNKLREAEKLTLAEVLVSEGVVTDQELGTILDRFSKEGFISSGELNLLSSEFPSNWERWKEMEERDEETENRLAAEEKMDTEAIPQVTVEPEEDGEEESAPPEEKRKKERPLTERVHRGSLQEALEDLMTDSEKEKAQAPKVKLSDKYGMSDPYIGKSFGGARVVSKLREEPLGVLYKGIIDSLGKEVIIRLVKSDVVPPAGRKKIVEHARKSEKIEHRGVAEIITAEEEIDCIYIISRYVEGQTLKELISKEGRIQQDEAIDIVLQVARALRAGHSVEMYHGDVSPKNIIMEEGKHPVILDFGLLKSAEMEQDDDTGQALFMGTPHFMAPEQFSGSPADARTDIYSLGVVMYRMLTGMLPFDGATPFAIKDAHEKGYAKSITEVDRGLNPTVSKLVNKMIARESDDRYQTVNELVNDLVDLKQYLSSGGDAPPIARTDATGAAEMDEVVQERAQKYKTVMFSPDEKKKGKKSVVFIILFILILAGGGIGYLYVTRPDVFKLSASFEEKAAEKYAAIRRAADLHFSKEEYSAALSKLEEFPSEYTSSQARRQLEQYRADLLKTVRKTIEEQKNRIEELFNDERVEDARRLLRGLKSRLVELEENHGKKYPQVAALGDYMSSLDEFEQQINEVLKNVENFKEDIARAESLIKEDKLADARNTIKKYLESPIAKHRENSAEMMERIEQREKVLDLEGAKKRELAEFDKSIDSARAILKAINQLELHESQSKMLISSLEVDRESYEKDRFETLVDALNEYEKNLNRLVEILEALEDKDSFSEVFSLIDVYWKAAKDLRTALQMSQEELKKSEEYKGKTWWEVVTGKIDDLKSVAGRLKNRTLEVSFAVQEKLLTKASSRVRSFISTVDHYAAALNAMKNDNMELFESSRNTLDDLVDSPDKSTLIGKVLVQALDTGKRLLQLHHAALNAKKDDDSEVYKKEMEEIIALAQSQNPYMSMDEKLKADIEAVAKSIDTQDVEKVDTKVNLIIADMLDSYRNSERQRIKVEAGFVISDLEKMLSKFRIAKIEREKKKLFADQIKNLHEKIENGDYDGALTLINRAYKEPGNPSIENSPLIFKKELSDEEKQALMKVEKEARERAKFLEDMKKIDELIEKNEFDAAKRLCLAWRYDSRDFMSSLAEKKYYEIMDKKEPDMVFVEGGTAQLGSELEEDNNPERKQIFRNFYIDRYEVSCVDYEKFINDTGHSPPNNWPRGMMPRQWSEKPVTGITWEDAAAYAQWAGKRLPTDSEWEIAASFKQGGRMLYPWGDEFDSEKANIGSGTLWDESRMDSDKSPLGVINMAGNAAEWTSTKSAEGVIVRGSSADPEAISEDARTTRRKLVEPEKTDAFLGFRCAKDVE